MPKKKNRRILLQFGILFFLLSLLLWAAQIVLIGGSTVAGYAGNIAGDTDITEQQLEVLEDLISESALAGTIIIVLFCALLLVSVWFLILRPMKKVQGIVRDYAGDQDADKATEQLSRIRSRNEIGVLANDIGDMARNLRDYTAQVERMAAEKERLTTELEIARRVQESQLPSSFPAFPERDDFDLYASMKPAAEVGGDFYDFFMIDENRLALVIADVSDKGIPAALFMMVSKALITSRIHGGDSPSEALGSINRQLCVHNNANMFVTVWLAVIDLKTGRGIVSNAGHEHPILMKCSERTWNYVCYIHSPGVAMKKSIRYEEHEMALDPGDCLFVYTDGVPEARDAEGRMYTTDRLLSALNAHAGEAPQAVVEAIERDLAAFIGKEEPFDDMTMLCFRYRGGNES